MYENKNDRQFDNAGKGQKEEDSQNREDTSSQEQTQSDRFDDLDSDSPSTEDEKTWDNVGEHLERNPMKSEEYYRSNLQATPINNDFSSMNEDGERDEEKDLDLDEEDLEEEDDDENEETVTRVYGDDRSGLGDSPDRSRDGYRNDERKNPNEATNY